MHTIIHLEQSEFIKKMAGHILMEKGFHYVPVNTAQEVYELIETEGSQILLIITSMMITDTTIEEFMKRINQSVISKVPVFVVTGNHLVEDKKRVLELGVTDYITKDNLAEELLKHIKYLLKEDELMECLKEARIAIVDDSNFDLNIDHDVLHQYSVENVDYYHSGLELLNSGKKYDLYLVDMVLDKEFGKNVIIQIRKNNINSSIIVISSLTNPKTISSILNAGADDYIQKPIQQDLFIAKLKSNMRNYALLKEMNKLIKQFGSVESNK